MTQTSASFADVMLDRSGVATHGKYVSFALTLIVHLLLAAFLFYGIHWQTQVNDAVEVELVRAVPSVAAEPPPPMPTAPPPRPERKLESRVEPKPVAPLPKPDIALKDEKKEKPKPKALPPPAPTPHVDPFQKQLEQELKRTTAERKSAEASSAAAKELADFQSAQAASAKSKAIADYIGKIRARIKSNIILPADIKGNPEAVFDVVQFPSGELLSVRLKKTSGHAGYDAAVERAILKSSPLPKPERGDLFARNLELKFHPLED